VTREYRIQRDRREASSRSVLYLRAKVVDVNTGEPLVGAYVKVAGSVLGAITNEQGVFQIPTTLREPVTVEISYMSYKSQCVTLIPGSLQKELAEIRMEESTLLG